MKESEPGVGRSTAFSHFGQTGRACRVSMRPAPSPSASSTHAVPPPSAKDVSMASTRRWRSVSLAMSRSATTRRLPPASSGSSPSDMSMVRPPTRALMKPFLRSSETASLARPLPRSTVKPTSSFAPSCPAIMRSAARTGSDGTTSTPQSGQWSRPMRANKSLRWSLSSVAVPTVERLPRTGFFCSSAIAGRMFLMASRSGRSMRSIKRRE